jgi:hypothetical protein
MAWYVTTGANGMRNQPAFEFKSLAQRLASLLSNWIAPYKWWHHVVHQITMKWT